MDKQQIRDSMLAVLINDRCYDAHGRCLVDLLTETPLKTFAYRLSQNLHARADLWALIAAHGEDYPDLQALVDELLNESIEPTKEAA